jgi:3-dehydroquinate synthase
VTQGDTIDRRGSTGRSPDQVMARPADRAQARVPEPEVAMTITAHEHHRVRDALELPPAGDRPLVAGARRSERYRIHVVATVDEAIARALALLDGRGVALLVDETVETLYGGALLAGLRAGGHDPIVRTVPAGEASKSVEQALAALDWLARSEHARRDVLLTVGGGVVTDMGGWVASAYMRGIPYVNVPTTLLAQVDGAVGGKVAVNHPLAKNLIGAFHQPAGVIAAIEFLTTVGDRELCAGLAEAIKKAVIASPAYWAFIDEHAERLRGRDTRALSALVRAAAAIKSALIERDPYELDLRRPLNFGHAIGHALETVTGYGPLLHGEAVAYGMVVETAVAVRRGLAPQRLLDDLTALLARCGLPTCSAELPAVAPADDVIAALGKVRLIRDGSLRIVLPIALGETVIADDVGERELREALEAVG